MFEFSPWHWFILTCVFLIIEVLVPLAFFLWLAGAAVATGLISLLFPAMSWQVELAIFSLCCFASIIGWIRFRPKAFAASDQPHLSQRNEQYLNQTVVVCEAIENGVGKVKVNDSIWKAQGPDAPVGQKVVVKRVEGSLFHVE